jgi:hypothetical protein
MSGWYQALTAATLADGRYFAPGERFYVSTDVVPATAVFQASTDPKLDAPVNTSGPGNAATGAGGGNGSKSGQGRQIGH